MYINASKILEDHYRSMKVGERRDDKDQRKKKGNYVEYETNQEK